MVRINSGLGLTIRDICNILLIIETITIYKEVRMNTITNLVMDHELSFEGIEQPFFLIGLLNEFVNRLQTKGDSFFEEISWKQCFLLICTKLFSKPPTINELSQVFGSSHQNVKQMLIKLEKAGFIELVQDEMDRRKLRIMITEKAQQFDQKYEKPSQEFIGQLYQKIDPKELEITIRTLIQLDHNLKEI